MDVRVGTIKKTAPKNSRCRTVVLEKTLESPLDGKESQPVNPKGDQSWIFIGRTEAEVPILWPPDAKNWLIGKDPDAGKDCWWWTEKPGVLQSLLGSQRVGHDWVIELKDYSMSSSNLWHVMMASSIMQFHNSSPSFLDSLFFLFLFLGPVCPDTGIAQSLVPQAIYTCCRNPSWDSARLILLKRAWDYAAGTTGAQSTYLEASILIELAFLTASICISCAARGLSLPPSTNIFSLSMRCL